LSILDGRIGRRRLTSRVGVERFFSRKIIVTESVITIPPSFAVYFKNFFISFKAFASSDFLVGFIQIVFKSRLNHVFWRLA